jgi:hypothetical protein
MEFNLEKDFFDKEYLLLLCQKFISLYDLSNYVKEINIIDGYHEKFCACYFPIKQELNFYLKSIYESFYKYITQYKIYTNIREQNRLYAHYFLQIMLHELTHVEQTKLSYDDNCDSLHILVKEGIELGSRCPNDLTIREKLLYSFFYNNILTEKNANCNSIKYIIELNETEDFLSKNELIAYKGKLEKYLAYGYTTKSAAENYYILRGKQKEYKKILFRENYDEYTRKSWGMPLND